VIRVTLKERNYTGVACGLDFTASVAETDLPRDHFMFRRLEALFPGVKIEEMDAEEPTKGDDKTDAEKDAEARAMADMAAKAEAERQAKVKAEMAAQAAKEAAELGDDEDEDDEDEDDGIASEPPLGPGSSVVVDYKGEVRTGEIVKALEGKFHVKLDDDDANYRVIDADKIVG